MQSGMYKNPIIFADYSDPDVVRAGNGYYMTASSFNYTPGLPILYSNDLINWRLEGYAVKELGSGYRIPRHSEGIWAPAIRYYGDMFYIYYGMPDEGLYVIRGRFKKHLRANERLLTSGGGDDCGDNSNDTGNDTDSRISYVTNNGISIVKGDDEIIWDKPVCVLEGKGLIDPCPYVDDEGNRCLIHAYAKSRIGFKSMLGMVELSDDGLKAVSEDHFIFNGNITDESMMENKTLRYSHAAMDTPDEHKAPAVTIEGPKVYKRGDFFYILAPAGGVREGWQLALRAKDIRGPYECKVVMHKGEGIINGPHQGGMVTDGAGDDWFIHFQDLGAYGRVCHLQPVSWHNDWPVIGVCKDGSGCGEPVYEYARPCPCTEDTDSSVIYPDTPFSTRYDLQWLGNHSEEYFEITDGDGRVLSKDMTYLINNANRYTDSSLDVRLKLQALNEQGRNAVLWRLPGMLTRKLDGRNTDISFVMDVSGMSTGDRAGVSFMGGSYCFMEYRRTDGEHYEVCFGVSRSDGKEISESRKVLMTGAFKDCRLFSVNISCRDEGSASDRSGRYDIGFTNVKDCRPKAAISFTLDDKKILSYPEAEGFIPSDHTWVGAKVGIYAMSAPTRGGYITLEGFEWKTV